MFYADFPLAASGKQEPEFPTAAQRVCQGESLRGWQAIDLCLASRNVCVAFYGPAGKAFPVVCADLQASTPRESPPEAQLPMPNWREHVQREGERLCLGGTDLMDGWYRVVVDTIEDGRHLVVREAESCFGQTAAGARCIASYHHGGTLLGFVELQCANRQLDVTYHEDLRE